VKETIFQILPRGLGGKTSENKRDGRELIPKLGFSHPYVSMRD
jgi:hypothetical protein